MENNQGEKKRYTKKEVIGFTINILEEISYPAFLMEMHPAQVMEIKQKIIDPIAAAKGNLRTLMAEIESAEKAKEAEPDNVIDLGVIDLGDEEKTEEGDEVKGDA